MSRRVLFALIIAMLVLAGCASTAVLESPRQADVPAGVAIADVENAIIDAMRDRGWSVHERSRGKIVADLNLRAHFARVDIRYNTDSVTLEYVDSRELEYAIDDGQPVIHDNFNSWTMNLIDDIERHLSYIE